MSLTVQEFFNRLDNGEKAGEIYEELGIHRTTIPTKLRRMGYRSDRKSGKYIWEGEGKEPLNFDLLGGGGRITPKKGVKAKSGDSVKPERVPNGDKNVNNVDEHSEPVKIQFVEEKRKKIYKGYYLSEEVVTIMDKIQNKSDVVEEALRKLFKEQGLL